MVKFNFGTLEFKQQTGTTLYNNTAFEYNENGAEQPPASSLKRNNLFEEDDFHVSSPKPEKNSKWRFFEKKRKPPPQTNVDSVDIDQTSSASSPHPALSPRTPPSGPQQPAQAFGGNQPIPIAARNAVNQGGSILRGNNNTGETTAHWEAEVKRLFTQERKAGEAVTLTAPSSGLVHCYVKRFKNMLGQTTHYSLFLHSGLLLMSARKRKKSKTPNIIFGLGNEEIFKDSCFSKMRANNNSTEYTLCTRDARSGEYEIEEEGIVFQYANSFNRSCPARILIAVPSPDVSPAPGRDDRSLLGTLSSAVRRELSPAQEQRVALMSSSPPEWDEEMKTYTLDFKGRVREASIKNFQLVAWDHNADRRGSDVLLQFGRQDDSTFILDFSYPFNVSRAFAAALASINSSNKH